MSFSTFVDSPAFDGPFISAPDLNTLLNNTLLIDAQSRRGRRLFQSSAQPQRFNSWPRQNPLRHWWGSFQYRTGLTTLTYIIEISPNGGTQTFQCLLNGAVVDSFNPGAGGAFTRTVTLSGITDRQVCTVELRTSWASSAPSNEGGSYVVRDVYVSPYSAVAASIYGAWPGLPTISGTQITNTQAQQISNACDWLMRRINVLPLPLFQQLSFSQTRDKPQTWFMWSGTFTRENSDRLKILSYISNVCNTAEKFQLLIDGSVVAETSVLTVGQSARWEPDIDITGYAAGRHNVTIQSVISTGTPYKPPQFTRFSLGDAYTYNNGVAGGIPAESVILEDLSWLTLKGRFSAIVTLLQAAYDRVNANPDVFDRARLYRRRYVFSDSYNSEWAANHVPVSIRQGEVLYARGQDVAINYGPLTITRNEGADKAAGTYTYESATSNNIIPSDSEQDIMMYLDSQDGLSPGTQFYLSGVNIIYAAQELSA